MEDTLVDGGMEVAAKKGTELNIAAKPFVPTSYSADVGQLEVCPSGVNDPVTQLVVDQKQQSEDGFLRRQRKSRANSATSDTTFSSEGEGTTSAGITSGHPSSSSPPKKPSKPRTKQHIKASDLLHIQYEHRSADYIYHVATMPPHHDHGHNKSKHSRSRSGGGRENALSKAEYVQAK